MYSVLPFIDQKNLWSLGSGIPSDNQNPTKKQKMALQALTALSIYYCPSRRPVTDYPATDAASQGAYNILVSGWAAKCDYAINNGDTAVDQGGAANLNNTSGHGPPTLAMGDSPKLYTWPSTTWLTGVSFLRSQITMAHLAAKGATNEYLIGEKYLNPDSYTNSNDSGDNEWATSGWDNDTCRTAHSPSGSAGSTGADPQDTPMQDKPGYSNQYIWGSPHPSAVHMAFCDGSVHNISYSIDPTTHGNLANRNTRAAIDPTKVQ